jgi:hypothetical protein
MKILDFDMMYKGRHDYKNSFREGTEKGFRWMNNKEKRHKLDGAYTQYVTKVYVFLTRLVAA